MSRLLYGPDAASVDQAAFDWAATHQPFDGVRDPRHLEPRR